MVTIRQAFIPAGNSNRPGTKLQGGRPTFITIHETANTKPGTDAEMHRGFAHGANGLGGGACRKCVVNGVFMEFYEGVSFHYAVDDKEAVQLLPDDEVGFHAGDGLGPNSGGATSIGIETCVNSDGDFQQALRNLAELVALLMQRHGIPLANIVQHNHWSGKDCPHQLRQAGWAGLVAAIATAHAGLGFPDALQPDGTTRINGVDFGGTLVRVDRVEVGGVNAQGDRFSRRWQSGALQPWILVASGVAPVAGAPSFPGALRPNGGTRLNGFDFHGILVRVERVEVAGVNAQGQRFSRRWQDGALAPWILV